MHVHRVLVKRKAMCARVVLITHHVRPARGIGGDLPIHPANSGIVQCPNHALRLEAKPVVLLLGRSTPRITAREVNPAKPTKQQVAMQRPVLNWPCGVHFSPRPMRGSQRHQRGDSSHQLLVRRRNRRRVATKVKDVADSPPRR